MNCSVCIEPIKSKAECPGCDYQVCLKCTKKYILSLEVPVKCMNCKVPWSRKTIVNMCGDYFMNHTYKNRKQELLFELETALMPETNEEAITYKKYKDMAKEIARLTIENKEIGKTVNQLRRATNLLDNGVEQAIETFKASMEMMNHYDRNNQEIQFLTFKQ